MDALRKAELEGQCQAIRASLKEWEHDWSASNGGAKPSRDAIKANADIARKYKEYNKLRDIISGKIKEESVSTKRKPTETRQKEDIPPLQFGTPAFLRRKTLPAVEETEEYESPKKLRRISRKPFARGLSAIVANLRKVEEEHIEDQFDDDEAAMREMEAESFAATQPELKKPVEAVPIVPDSQPGVKLLGGFDDENAYDSPVEDQTDRGRPVREFKKKAPKRTTRKVIMRPIFSKRPTETQPASESDLSDEEDAPVPETQVDATALGAPLADDSDGHSDFTPDHDHDEGDEAAGADLAKAIRAGRKRTTKALDEEAAQAKKEKGKTKGKDKEKATDKDKDEGKVRKVARKVNELAHANFRRLKLRNNGAKGGPGYNSRFRRR
ncbi:unnamed protein product [Parascedosporium putredinis]|uniref:DNA replication regulator SLD2 n=1 Tax=Parascedosporium putredinis TaxID=1442378 RepID=A0A9P1MBQ1_9PEZI|nr:unnamed protein product [Parascedosporium putredinis]CAI7999996.1 unnamed protein product [Parascedosporium putredinis]